MNYTQGTNQKQDTQILPSQLLLIASVLTILALIAAVYSLIKLSLPELAYAAVTVLIGIVVAVLQIDRVVQWIPKLIPDILPRMANIGIVKILTYSRYLTLELLPRWRDALIAMRKKLWSHINWWQVAGVIESRLRSWRVALMILLILGLLMAWLVSIKKY